MFKILFGNSTVNKVLLYLCRFDEGYARGIAKHFSIPVNMVQKQLEKLETAEILISRFIGRTRLYRWNMDYPFQKELYSLLNKAFDFMPKKDIRKFYT